MEIKGEGIAKATNYISSSLDGFRATQGRRTGNTTRLIDLCIQRIFKGQACLVRDHDLRGRNAKMNRYLFIRIENRLRLEHQHIFDMICFDTKNLAIYIYSDLEEKNRVIQSVNGKRTET